MLESFIWEPGNATRYDLVYGKNGSKCFVAWMQRGGSGGTAFQFDTRFHTVIHYSYLQEKMDLRLADAAALCLFLQEKGHEVELPEKGTYQACTSVHQKPVLRLVE